MFKVMDNPILIENNSDTDQQLAKSIANGSVGIQSRGTPIIDELWDGEIRPSEMMKSNEYEPVNAPAAKQPAIKPVKVKEPEKPKPVEFPTAKSFVADAINSLTAIFKSDDEDEDDIPEEKFKDKKKEVAEKSLDSETEYFIDLVKSEFGEQDTSTEASDEDTKEPTDSDEKDEKPMTDAEATGAADKEANKSVSDVLDDLIKATKYKPYGGHTEGEGSRGGHVIGHTQSGKPIYRGAISPTGKVRPQGHEEYSKQDHLDAAKVHDEQPWIKPEDYANTSANSPTLHDSMGKHHKEEANKRSNARPLSPAVQARRNELDRFPAAAAKTADPDKKSEPEGDLSKSTALGVDEISVDQWGVPVHCGNAIEVHDGDKVMLKELIQAGVIDPEHEMDKRVPQVINRVLGGVY